MIEPLSQTKRRAYLVLSALAFVVVIPLLIFYSEGYRLGDDFTFVKTGGVFVRSDLADTRIYVDDVLTEETGLLLRNSFIQDLAPGSYDIRVEKEGYRPWVKGVTVEENFVTEIHHVPVEVEVSSTTVRRFLVVDDEVTTTRDPRHPELAELFATTTATSSAPIKSQVVASTTPTSTAPKLALVDPRIELPGFRDRAGVYSWLEDGKVVMVWTGSYERTPYYFCQALTCVGTTTLALPEPIVSFEWSPSNADAIVAVTPSAVYVVDADTRSTPNAYPILWDADLDVRLSGSDVVVKRGDEFVVFEL